MVVTANLWRKSICPMPLTFWIKRFLTVFTGAFVVLLALALLRGRGWERAVGESALWAGIATVLFTATRVYRSRRGEHCELCGDTPEGGKNAACEIRKK
jgi:hypothetical protein